MRASPPARRGKQRGALIVALMAGIAIMMILSTVAVQAWADIARRDAEAEMIFRAQDIVRALRRYQADRGQLPTELKMLLEVGQKKPQYMIRQLWKDPLVKGGKWQLLYANPAGGFIDPSAPEQGATGLPGQPGMTGVPTSVLQPEGAGGFPPIGKKGEDGNEFTGMPIAGVKSRCTEHPFRRYKDKAEYSEWVFTIFDLEPRAPAMSQTPTGQPNPMPTMPPTGRTGPGGATPAVTFPPKK